MAIGAKLIHLQVGQHAALRLRAERQQQFEIPLSPTRGIIYDRNGQELARSVQVKSLYASPSQITNPASVADHLSRLLGKDRDEVYKQLTSGKVLAAIKRKLSDQEVAKVEALQLPGLRFVNEMKRFYVGGTTAAHVLGHVNIEEEGKGGVEISFNKLICGQGGRLLLNVDALKNSYDHALEESVPGANVTLTIDTMIQHYAEKALQDAVRASRARGGTVVVMRPATGEILALANYPTFDPNKVSASKEIARRNRAVEVVYEPGSMFKIVAYSAALEEGLISPNTKIHCNGQIRVGNRVVNEKAFGMITATQALAKSSNVGAIKIGQMLGNERFARYIDRFGFGRRTEIEVPGESRGLLKDVSRWNPATITSIPMGYEVGVTAIQAVAAFASIANGGQWARPHLVSRITSSSGDLLYEHQGETRPVVSEATAATLKAMLEGVVINGTAKRAHIEGYRAAGKTGTARKIDEATGRYSAARHIASFAGFAPVDNPEIACIVSIDEPKGAYHGGDVAAPIFARVVADALQVLNVAPEDDLRPSLVAEDLRVYDVPQTILGTNPTTTEEGSESEPVVEVTTETNEGADKEKAASKRYGSVVVPDLMGRGIREAVAICAVRGLKIKASGDGVVAGQNPAPDTLVAEGSTCQVRLSKRLPAKQQPEIAARETKTKSSEMKPKSKSPKNVTARTN